MNNISYLIFISIYLVFWNRGRRKHLTKVDEALQQRQTRGIGNPGNGKGKQRSLSEQTMEQKLNPTPPKPYPYDITSLTYLSLEAVVKTFFFCVVLFLVMMMFSGSIATLSSPQHYPANHPFAGRGLNPVGQVQSATSTIGDAQAAVMNQVNTLQGKFGNPNVDVDLGPDRPGIGLSVIVEGCFNFGPLFKALFISTILAAIYSNIIHSYRENLYNKDSLKLHVTMLSVLHAAFFVGVYTYFSFQDVEESEDG